MRCSQKFGRFVATALALMSVNGSAQANAIHWKATDITGELVFEEDVDLRPRTRIGLIGTSGCPGQQSREASITDRGSGGCNFLGTLGGSWGYTGAISSDGKFAAGMALTTGDVAQHAFLYSASGMLDLGTLGGRHSNAMDVNNAGTVVGWSMTLQGAWQPFMYSDGQMTAIAGSVPMEQGAAYLINDAGRVAGWGLFEDGPREQAFIVDRGELTRIGSLGGRFSQSLGLSDSGLVVGWSTRHEEGDADGFIWDSGTLIDIEPLLRELGIVDTGMDLYFDWDGNVVGQGLAGNGEWRWFRLEQALNQVPEPGGIALIAWGLLSVLAITRRRFGRLRARSACIELRQQIGIQTA